MFHSEHYHHLIGELTYMELNLRLLCQYEITTWNVLDNMYVAKQ